MGAEALVDARSRELYERARNLIPGGVNSPVRAMKAVGREPLFIERGEGPEIVDVDGNRYIDYVCSWGPLILGHAHPEVVAAVASAAERGTSFGAPTPGEVELAQEVVNRVPCARMVRLTSSGTEATMTAVRLARAATGRDKVLKFAGAYHGHVDGLLADAGSGLATQGIPASPGVSAAQAADTVVASWNDAAQFEQLMDATGDELAAVIAEGVPANMGVVPASEGFLALLRERSARHGALLVLDEVITGFRVAPGGAQELFGIEPDLAVLGKVLGGGLPLAAVAGKRKLLQQLAPSGATYQAGTLSGNPLATAAGLATLAQLTPQAYERLGGYTERLATGLRRGGRRRRRAGAGGLALRPADGLLLRAAGRALGAGPRHQRRRLRSLPCRHARARHLPAAVPVRSLVPLAGARRRRARSHPHGRDRGLLGAGRMKLAALHGLHGLVGAEDGLLADALVDAVPPDGDVFGPLVAAGERVGDAAGEYALLVESIFEGYLLHYGDSRLVASPDQDLLLLSGDYFYALGLSRLAALGDLEAVEELADLITLCAQAHAAGSGRTGGDDADTTVLTGGALGPGRACRRRGALARAAAGQAAHAPARALRCRGPARNRTSAGGSASAWSYACTRP